MSSPQCQAVFDLNRAFNLVFITANSLLHLHLAEDLVSCLQLVRRHMAPEARFIFDVFNPSAAADGARQSVRAPSSGTPPERPNAIGCREVGAVRSCTGVQVLRPWR
jgi:hypothetical protein